MTDFLSYLVVYTVDGVKQWELVEGKSPDHATRVFLSGFWEREANGDVVRFVEVVDTTLASETTSPLLPWT